MAVQTPGSTTSSRTDATERTPLITESRSPSQDDDASSYTFTDPNGSREEDLDDVDKANQHVGSLRGLFIMLGLCGLMFLQAANLSIITTTQGKIAEDLDAFAEASWFTSAYMISASSTTILAGRFCQIFSPRYCVLLSSLLFAVGGIVASQATSFAGFVLGRILQGTGGGAIMPVSLFLVLELAPKKRRGLFIGMVNGVVTMGVSFGAVIAGFLLPRTGWRFMLWIQAPLATVFSVGIFFSIPKTFTTGLEEAGSIQEKLAKIDYLGAFVLVVSLVLFLFGLSTHEIQYIPVVISLVLFTAFIYIEFNVAVDPIIPITVLRSRGALLSCIAQLGAMISRWTVLFYAPAYALSVRGWSPATAGTVLIPTNLGFAIGGLLVGGLHVRRAGSFWLPSVISNILFTCTFVILARISNERTPTVLYLLGVLANGLTIGASLNYTLAHVLHLTPTSSHFMAASLLTTFRAFAGSFGSAIGGGLFIRFLKSRLESGFEAIGELEGREDLVRRLLGSPVLVQSLHGVEREVAVQSYVGALNRLFASAAIMAVFVVFAQAGTGWKAGEEGVGSIAGGEGTLGVEDEEWEEGMEQGV